MILDGEPSFLYGTVTDTTGAFVGMESAWGFAGNGLFDWLAEDFDIGCGIGSAELYCDAGILYFRLYGLDLDPAIYVATSTTCSPLSVTFDVSIDQPGCVGTFKVTFTL